MSGNLLSGFVLASALLGDGKVVDDDPLAALQGTWKVVKFTLDGVTANDPQMAGAKITFEKDEMRIAPGDGSTQESFKIKPEADANPAALHVSRTQPANRPQEGWHIYEVNNGRLKMAFFDAVRGRPKSFNDRPELIVVELEKVPPDDQGDKPKQARKG